MGRGAAAQGWFGSHAEKGVRVACVVGDVLQVEGVLVAASKAIQIDHQLGAGAGCALLACRGKILQVVESDVPIRQAVIPVASHDPDPVRAQSEIRDGRLQRACAAQVREGQDILSVTGLDFCRSTSGSAAEQYFIVAGPALDVAQ